MFGWRALEEKIADRLADRAWRELEDAGALPLPPRHFDVVVDDPDMAGRHEYRLLMAQTATGAGVVAYRRAMRDEGFRCVSGHPPGDERTLEVAREVMASVTVHGVGEHPAIDYAEPPERIVRVG